MHFFIVYSNPNFNMQFSVTLKLVCCIHLHGLYDFMKHQMSYHTLYSCHRMIARQLIWVDDE